MKTIYAIIIIASFASIQSCKKCYKCSVSVTDINGTETGKKNERHCLEKDNYMNDYFKNNPDCKPTI